MKTFAVLGLGPTLKYFMPDSGATVIGVNDFSEKLLAYGKLPYEKPYLLLIDPPSSFTVERISFITRYVYRLVVTSEILWRKHFDCDNQTFKSINAIPPVNGLVLIDMLDNDEFTIPCSLDSTFAACILAYKMGAERIIIYGADFNDHKTLSQPENLDNILKNYSLLQVNLKIRDVILQVYSRESRLSLVLDALC